MDVVRAQKPAIPKAAYAAAGTLALAGLAAWVLFAVMPAQGGVAVDKSTLVTDVAVRGTLVRSVSGQGSFVPERIRIVSATQPGVVNAVYVKPGSAVEPGSVIAQLQDSAIEAAVANAQSALQVALANLADAQKQAEAAVIGQQSTLDDAHSQARYDALKAASYATLYRRGLLATLQYQQAQIQAQQSADQVRSHWAQVRVAQADGQAKVAAAQAQVDEARTQLAAAQANADALTVRASTSGIVQDVNVDPGTSLAPRAEIARIADTRHLKAVLQVAETDVHAVVPGMRAGIDGGDGSVAGRVSRIAPAAQNGTVAVDVVFEGALPGGSRPDASVTGTIVLARLPNAVSIARPAGAADGSTIDLFKVTRGGDGAVRVRVRLGQGSSDRVQVLSGLSPGDTVIVSDTSNYADQPVLRLK